MYYYSIKTCKTKSNQITAAYPGFEGESLVTLHRTNFKFRTHTCIKQLFSEHVLSVKFYVLGIYLEDDVS